MCGKNCSVNCASITYGGAGGAGGAGGVSDTVLVVIKKKLKD